MAYGPVIGDYMGQFAPSSCLPAQQRLRFVRRKETCAGRMVPCIKILYMFKTRRLFLSDFGARPRIDGKTVIRTVVGEGRVGAKN